MLTAFIQGFASELVKQASHPLFQTVAKGETMLGQKVRSAISRTCGSLRCCMPCGASLPGTAA